MAKLLNDDVVKQIEDAFAPMKEAVSLLYFGQKENCEYCADTQQLLEEVPRPAPCSAFGRTIAQRFPERSAAPDRKVHQVAVG